MYFNDKDFDQKIRFQRILWKMGFWSRIEIPVTAYDIDSYTQNLKKYDLTDMDVYGEKVNCDFSITKYIGDCKSGKNIKMVERVFWLKGVMEFVNADKSFLIKKKISSNIRLILDKLSMYGVDNTNLDDLEKMYNVDSINELFNKEYYEKRLQLIGLLKDEYEKIFKYLGTRYWFNESHVNLKTLLAMLYKNDFYKNFKAENQSHQFLIMEIIILLCRNIFECCNYVMHRNFSNIEIGVLEFIHGGVTGYTNKVTLMKDLNPILKSFSNDDKAVKQVIIKPDYFDSFVKLIANCLSESDNIIQAMRYLELLQYEIIMDKTIDLKKYIGADYSDITLKMSKDIIEFYLEVTKVDRKVLEGTLYK